MMRKSGLNVAAFAAAFLLAFVCSSGALALDATSFDPRNVSVEADSISGVPVGTIITWPVATNPEGWDEGKWLECNGQTISQTVYPELFALVGGVVPDLRNKKLAYGSSVPGQTLENGNAWLRHSSGLDMFEIVTKSPATLIHGGKHMGNNIYYEKGSEGGGFYWWPIYGGNESNEFGVRYLMRALP